jgi:hypothetical protein
MPTAAASRSSPAPHPASARRPRALAADGHRSAASGTARRGSCGTPGAAVRHRREPPTRCRGDRSACGTTSAGGRRCRMLVVSGPPSRGEAPRFSWPQDEEGSRAGDSCSSTLPSASRSSTVWSSSVTTSSSSPTGIGMRPAFASSTSQRTRSARASRSSAWASCSRAPASACCACAARRRLVLLQSRTRRLTDTTPARSNRTHRVRLQAGCDIEGRPYGRFSARANTRRPSRPRPVARQL